MAGWPQMQRARQAEIPGDAGDPAQLLAIPAARSLAAPHKAAWLGSLTVFAVASALLGWLFRSEIAAAVQVWSSSATFGHAFFIVPISAFLFYRMRHRLALIPPAPAPWAAAPLAALALLWAVGAVANVLVVKQLAVVGLWQGMFLLVLGWPVTRAALFPLLYLYFAVPLGSSAIPVLQDVTAQMVVHLLRLTGMPVFLDGYLIQIPSGSFLVAEACSGVRYLIVSVALGVLVAHLLLRSWRRRLLFVGLSIVIPIIANGIRAYGIIMLAHLSDYRIAADVDHVFYGLAFLSIVTLALLGIAVLLRERDGAAEAAPTGATRPQKAAKETWATQVACSGAALASVLLLQAWVATAKDAPAVLAPARLLLPEAAAPWQAISDATFPWMPGFHSPDAVLRGSYRLDGDQVDVHIAHYAYQREGAEAVSELNDPGGVGKPWRVLQARLAEAGIEGRELRFTRLLLANRSERYIVWYWYRVAGENAGSRLLGKLLELKALLPGTEEAASVIAIGSRVSEDAERTDALLRAFLAQNLDSSGSLVRLDALQAGSPAAAAP